MGVGVGSPTGAAGCVAGVAGDGGGPDEVTAPAAAPAHGGVESAGFGRARAAEGMGAPPASLKPASGSSPAADVVGVVVGSPTGAAGCVAGAAGDGGGPDEATAPAAADSP